MKRNQSQTQISNDQSLGGLVNSLTQITLADDTIACQICDEILTDGDEVVCHLQSPPAATSYEITQIRCPTHGENVESLLTLGVDELIVNGRVGRCSDQATQQSWPVLLAPNISLISSAATATAQPVENTVIQQQSEENRGQDTVTVNQNQPTDPVENSESNETEFEETTLHRWDPTVNGGDE